MSSSSSPSSSPSPTGAQEFIALIQNKQLESTLKLAKQNTIKIGDQVYTRKSLTAKQWREIIQLNQKMVEAKTELDRTDCLIEVREKGAQYYFNIPPDVFDANYELLSPIIEGHILRSNMGASSDLDFEDLLKKFEKYNNFDNGSAASHIGNSIKKARGKRRGG